MVEYGADIHAPDNSGKSPLQYAVEYEDFELCKLLIAKAASHRFRS